MIVGGHDDDDGGAAEVVARGGGAVATRRPRGRGAPFLACEDKERAVAVT